MDASLLNRDPATLEAARRAAGPILPRCGTWPRGYIQTAKDRGRCQETAAYWFVADDGELCPGGAACAACGERIVTEIRTKLGELWTLAPLASPNSNDASVQPPCNQER